MSNCYAEAKLDEKSFLCTDHLHVGQDTIILSYTLASHLGVVSAVEEQMEHTRNMDESDEDKVLIEVGLSRCRLFGKF